MRRALRVIPACCICMGACSPAIEKLWEFPTSAPLYSTPLVLEDLIVFGSESGTLHAVDRSGKARWQFAVPSAEIFSRPITDGERIFFGATNQTFYALSLSGRIEWQYSAKERIKSDAALSEGVVYMTSYDGHVYALDAQRGNLRWCYPAEEPSAPPVPSTPPQEKDKPAKLAAEPAKLAAEPAKSAEPDTQAQPTGQIAAPKEFSYAAPVIRDGVLYVGNLDGTMYALSTADGTLKWRFKTGGGITSTAFIEGEALYFGSKDDNVYAIDAATGTKVLWQFKTGDDVLSSPRVFDGVLWVGSNDHSILALDAKTGKEKCRHTAQGPVASYAVAYQNLILFATGQGDGSLYAIDRENCSFFFRYKTGYKIMSDPVVAGDRIFITSGDRKLYSFKINKTTP